MANRQTLMVRDLTPEEYALLEVCAQSQGYRPFSERRSRILLASSLGKPPLQIAAELQVDDETVRRAIRDFNTRGTAALIEGSSKPKHTGDLFVPGGRDKLIDLIRHLPKHYGFSHNEWNLGTIADAAFAQGLTKVRVSEETIRLALMRLEIKWGVFKRLLRRERYKPPSNFREAVKPTGPGHPPPG